MTRTEVIELLEKYSLYLEEYGYLDTDWRSEEPYAIDQFLMWNKEICGIYNNPKGVWQQ